MPVIYHERTKQFHLYNDEISYIFCIMLNQQLGSSTTHFEYLSHQILPGKPSLEDLPAIYVEEDNEADTVRICLIDHTLSCQIELQYTLFSQLPVLTRSMKIIHSGTEKIRLEAAMSFNLDLPDKEYEMLTLTGAWGRERHIQNVPLHQGIQSI